MKSQAFPRSPVPRHGEVHGPVKSFEAKTSPCLVPYAELPEPQRRKDAMFQRVVLAVAEALL